MGAAPSEYPTTATTSPPQTIAATSASSASATPSTAASAADASVSFDDTGIAHHQPNECALRNRRDTRRRPVGEVGTADEPYLLFSVGSAQPEPMGERQTRKPLGICLRANGRAQTFHVDVERGTVIERVHAVAAAR